MAYTNGNNTFKSEISHIWRGNVEENTYMIYKHMSCHEYSEGKNKIYLSLQEVLIT